MNSHIPFDSTQMSWGNPNYDGNSSNDPLVDKMIGNAYHVVRTVYSNLGNLNLLYNYLTTHGMVVGVQTEQELKALPKQFAKFARIYNFANTGDRQVTDYLYVEDDVSGIKPNDPTLTGSWVVVATSSKNNNTNQGSYIPYVYRNGNAIGGETSFKVPDGTPGVPFIIINGAMIYINHGFQYDPASSTVTLPTPLNNGDKVIALTVGVPASSNNPNVPEWMQVTWLYNNGSANGGEQILEIPYNFKDVPAIYKNGARLYKGLLTNSYSIDTSTRKVTLTELLSQGDRVIVIVGGEAPSIAMVDRTIQEVARSVNLRESDVVLSSNTNVVITGKKIIYDVVGQKIWSLPDLPPNAYIVGVTGNQLTYNPGNVSVTLLPAPGGQEAVDDILIKLSSTKDNEGDSMIRVKQPFSGSNPTTVHEKMRQSVTIQDGSPNGAEPDGVSDCTPALLNLLATNCTVIRFPYIPGTANIYYFSSFDPDALYNRVLDVDPSVKLSVPYDWLVGKASARYIGFTTDTRFIFRSLNTEYLASPYNNHTFSAKRTFLEEASFDVSKVTPINPNTDMTAQKIVWPNQDTWVPDTSVSSNAISISMSATTGDDSFRVAFMDVNVGQEISSCILINSTPQLAAIVRSSNGYSGVFAQPTQSGSIITQVSKEFGKDPVTTIIGAPLLRDHPAYSPINCEWKIRINGMTNYDVLLNGYLLTTVYTPGYIKDAGFGSFFNGGLINPLVNVYQPVLIKNNRYTRNGFISVKVFGDSISAPRADCWPNFLKDELEFSEGVRNWSIVNKAIPGDTTAGQLSIMQSEGVSDANIVVIAIGTNDGQGQTDLIAFKNNLTAMVNLCHLAGVTVIMCKFGLWYTQKEAGSVRGQPSANAEKAFRYRNTVARVAAETGAKLVDLTAIEGPIAAYYVNPNLSVNMVGAGDSVLHDNIHPTTTANCVIARAVARSIMGTLSSGRIERVSNMSVISAKNKWLVNTSDRPASVNISKGGTVSLGGIIFKSEGDTADGTQIATIPRNIAPINQEQFFVYSDTPGVSVIVSPAGDITLYGATSSTNFIGLSGLSWLVRE